MNYSKEYMSFLETHRQMMEFKDKMKQAASRHYKQKLEDGIATNQTWEQYKEESK